MVTGQLQRGRFVRQRCANMQLQNARQLKIHMRSLHEGGEATSWSVPAAPYCQRLHKQEQLYGGNCYCIY